MKRKAVVFLFFYPYFKMNFAKIAQFVKITVKKIDTKLGFIIFVCLKNRINIIY